MTTWPDEAIERAMDIAHGALGGYALGRSTIRAILDAAGSPPSAWRPISEYCDDMGWRPTCREGERDINLCRRRFGDEWIEHGSGVTTVTHHSFAAPTHFLDVPPLPEPPEEER